MSRQHLIFSKLRGVEIDPERNSSVDLIREVNYLGKGEFPYSNELQRRYEACENFEAFKDKQSVVETTKYRFSNELKYTFGLEFETSRGYVPIELLFRDGLIPLRDGSLDGGIEYSTVVLEGNTGLNLLKQQVDTLKKYTVFNKECSLHMHFGGFPLRAKKIFNVYQLCYYLQETTLSNIVPKYTFYTSKYKKSGKDYCKLLSQYTSFDDMFYSLVGQTYEGSLRNPHPADPTRSAKWNIQTRYFWVNFINFLCYDVNKTIEFRLLRPTYNLRKIQIWVYIFNAILKYAEELSGDVSYEKFYKEGLTLSKILDSCYPAELANILRQDLSKLSIETDLRNQEGDYIGSNLQFEPIIFSEELL